LSFNLQLIFMKKISYIFLLFVASIVNLYSQKIPSVIIDSTEVEFGPVSVPYWLKSGQSVNIGKNAYSISIIEFNVNGYNLEFSQIISLKSFQLVPTNKVWKIEGIALNTTDSIVSFGSAQNQIISSSNSTNFPSIYQSPVKFETPGTFKWKAPPGIISVCVETWGGGGAGPGVSLAGQHCAGGGGGGYGYGCYAVTPGVEYIVIVGNGGGAPSPPVGPATDGGISSFGNLIYASGGTAGAGPSTSGLCNGVTGGLGGTSNGQFVINGENGGNSAPCTSYSGKGGKGGNGGTGGASIYSSGVGIGGIFPGGGGSGSINTSSVLRLGGPGGSGKVVIYF
jgi:hypothetical protein